MTSLILQTGMPMTEAVVIREQLVACREPLERAGVLLMGKDGVHAWDRAVRQVLGGELPQPLKRAAKRTKQSPPAALVLSSEAAAGALASLTNVMALHAFSRDKAVPTKVVLVVREQLDLLNALYCHSVTSMQTAVGFEAFVRDPVATAGLELDDAFSALLDDTEIDVFAVPYSRLDDAFPARTILEAAHLPGTDAIANSRGAAESAERVIPLPGPVLLTATRLLHKRLTRLGVIRKRSSADVAAGFAALRTKALSSDWDDTTFWGWSEPLAEQTMRHYAAGNALFAARAWGTPWPDPTPASPQTRVDLPALPPPLVSDVMTMIHRVVDDLVVAPVAPVAPTAPTAVTQA